MARARIKLATPRFQRPQEGLNFQVKVLGSPSASQAVTLSSSPIELTAAAVEAIAQRTAELVAQRLRE
jgi:hypothetical protein